MTSRQQVTDTSTRIYDPRRCGGLLLGSARERAEPDGLVAVRAHKAKHVSDCVLCPRLIGMRERVVELPSGGWAHLFCVVPRTAPEPRQELKWPSASRAR